MAYLIAHWRGRLPLAISLWINFLALSLFISYIELTLIAYMARAPEHLLGFSIASLILTRLIIFPWQLRGLFRAAEQDFIVSGNRLRMFGVQILGVFSIGATLIYSLDVLQGVIHVRQQLSDEIRRPTPVGYVLSIDPSGTQLSLSGNLDIGVTTAVASLLATQTGVRSVVLDSPGGHLYEGRGLAKLFTEKQLDTYVYSECSSACATAFIGGVVRYLGPEGKLGFHQYRIDNRQYTTAVIFFDPVKEQQRDQALFKTRGISPAFLDSMFRQSADRIWFPSQSQLQQTGVVHTLIRASAD
jgi:hypothetical protein